MVQLGKRNRLKISRKVSFGAYLDGGDSGEILLPLKYLPATVFEGDEIEVFVYKDSEDRPVAVTRMPYGEVGEFVSLKVISVTKVGAFLDWGLDKDLFLPFGEQRRPVREGEHPIVYIFIDNSDRIAASTRLNRFFKPPCSDWSEKMEVDLRIWSSSTMGYSAIINGQSEGIIYRNEVIQPLRVGSKMKGYIKQIREDGKIDLTTVKPGYDRIGLFADILLDELKSAGGSLPFSDRSSPELIRNRFGVSKKDFKKAVGALYKLRKIKFSEDGISLVSGSGGSF